MGVVWTFLLSSILSLLFLPLFGLVGWLFFGLNDPLRQYFSLYRVVSQREGERGEKGQMRVKMFKQPPPAPTARAVGPCPTLIQTSRTPRHWKFTQDHRTTRPPPSLWKMARYRLKYCLKGPLNPKQPTNQLDTFLFLGPWRFNWWSSFAPVFH